LAGAETGDEDKEKAGTDPPPQLAAAAERAAPLDTVQGLTTVAVTESADRAEAASAGEPIRIAASAVTACRHPLSFGRFILLSCLAGERRTSASDRLFHPGTIRRRKILVPKPVHPALH
jgi:hypothetical protein